eukprot:CAMPEP_0184696584 /NCGR_PEP_ID=MMETSP0313-20130426/3826_1 /TAXON_ID=2792 /ORGANISM="Porphyridium aerugineum, Strain SAG 1380-2" /LENGTH=101 /DNA_ID=CAMNT_0027155229 /DNA_START=113 /DNA_END=418 /DNA_ORIENTATION=+
MAVREAQAGSSGLKAIILRISRAIQLTIFLLSGSIMCKCRKPWGIWCATWKMSRFAFRLGMDFKRFAKKTRSSNSGSNDPDTATTGGSASSNSTEAIHGDK